MTQVSRICILDNVLKDPELYRVEALKREFKTYEFPTTIFHGLSPGTVSTELFDRIRDYNPELVTTFSSFRRSPLGQVEPNFIHTDIDMGEWSGVFYLSPHPPQGDGTSFWTHRETGAIESNVPHERSAEGLSSEGWILREAVDAVFNRLLLFPSAYFHSRSIHENWGAGEDARLTQVVFGKGKL